ncbi:MAG TPA: pyridoxal-phosphate dependent enzyme, partial [Acidimicrobiia bacterium]|nr:pyridoxal-phosphate dependent enzyme [Acidimicrobiia bacterium]
MQAVDPINLFRITWHNDPESGGFGPVNVLEIPEAITGVPARIAGLVGKHFPTGAHKVGAAFGCLVPRLVHGEFDPATQRAVWPSTGNYCRGGAFDSALLGCTALAILPEEMSQERFRWLESIGAEVLATPGCESNVKEIFDACWDIKKNRKDCVVFNQFEEWGNYLWHYAVTTAAVEEAFGLLPGAGKRFAGWVSATGSAGTLAAGDGLKQRFPGSTITAAEALQCPTLLRNGFGGHRIEGIGDKHVPWIHNLRTTDMVMGIDDAGPMSLIRLFNEPAGTAYLAEAGIDPELIEQLPLLGISSVANLLSAIKMARWYELGPHDVVLTVATDSMEMYGSRLEEMKAELGKLDRTGAAVAHQRWLLGETTDNVEELGHWDRKRIHNLKYYTWIEQQGKVVEELDRQWDDPTYWTDIQALVDPIDELIETFNEAVASDES